MNPINPASANFEVAQVYKAEYTYIKRVVEKIIANDP